MSDVSEAALPLARAAASNSGTPVTLVSVLEMPSDLASFIGGGSSVDKLQDLEDAREAYLREIAATFEGIEVDTVVLRGSPAPELVKYADSLDDPLIVMCSHGHGGFRRMVAGSVMARVVHAVSCPVLVARAADVEEQVRQVGKVDSVLIPLDGSEFAEHALQAALHLFPQAELRLLRVPEMMTYPTTMYGSASYDTVDLYMDSVREAAQEYLTEKAEELSARGHNVTWEVRDGMSAEAITTAASEHGVDVIAMSSHGRTGFRRFVMGSVAERVLNEAPVPVLMIGPEEREDVVEE
jgi:nucleotide-binding universal stress UspA family protein